MSTQKVELIEELIRDGYLKTPRVIEAFRAIDRADFVLPKYRAEAYENYPLPLLQGQTISQPLTVAFLLELLDPQPGEKILDVGSGSGWTTALLAKIVGPQGKIFAVERIPELCEFGRKNVKKYNFMDDGMVEFFCQDGTDGLSEHAPFDKILIGASASREIPAAWREQLKIGGRIVAPVDDSIWVFIKKLVVSGVEPSETKWEKKEFPGFAFVPLVKGGESGIENPAAGEARQERQESGNNSDLIKRIWIFLVVFLVLTGVAFSNEIYLPHPDSNNPITITIPSGHGSRAIAELLKSEGVIRSPWTFIAYAALRGEASRLKPGTYTFQNLPIPQIVRDLAAGENRERTVTIPEGLTIPEVTSILAHEGITSYAEFLARAAASPSPALRERFDFLADKPLNTNFEGYLFPDTYRLFADAPTDTIIQKMLENFDRKLAPELRAEILRQKKTIFEIVTIASLIEREVRTDEDRKLVSGILWKRLELGIPLQVDATIVFIKGGNGNNGKISIADTKIPSPYNTYLNRGLPQGPIGNPGLSAIRATIYPKESSYLYYLSARDGHTIFSRTLEEHNEAKAKYLR